MPPEIAVAIPEDNLRRFKVDVDTLLSKRSYFIERVLPTLVEGKDFYLIQGKKSLGKAGAEKLANLYSLTATFDRDDKTLQSFSNIEGLIAYVGTLSRNGSVVGQGRGAALLSKNGGDVNKTIKMAQKSAYIDSVIRSTGLSDIFTQDIEDMPSAVAEVKTEYFPKTEASGEEAMTEKQKNLLNELIVARIPSRSERDRWLQEIESGMSKFDASEMISSFLMVSNRR